MQRRIDILENLSCVYNKVTVNTEKAQEKQKKQYAKKAPHGCDPVLRRNMLQKTEKGHKDWSICCDYH